MHSLDHIEHYTKAWIDHLQEPTESGVSRCPYAKKATQRYRKVYDYHSAYDFWEAVSEECDKFNGDYDVVLVAAATNNQHIDDQILGGGVDAINTFLNARFDDQAHFQYTIGGESSARNFVCTSRSSSIPYNNRVNMNLTFEEVFEP